MLEVEVEVNRKYLEALVRWYGEDNEDKIWLTRTEVGYILRAVGELPI